MIEKIPSLGPLTVHPCTTPLTLRQVVLLGEPGIGKTTTLFKFAEELSTRCARDSDAPIPVILPLREWQGGTDLDTFIKTHLGGMRGELPISKTA